MKFEVGVDEHVRNLAVDRRNRFLSGSGNGMAETQAGLADKAPWLLETKLREQGDKFSNAEAWSPYVVVDRKLYTGQNLASSKPLAERIIADVR